MTAWREELQQLAAAGVEPRYPWHEWLDGNARVLVAHVDYLVPTVNFQSQAHAAGKRRGIRVRTQATTQGCVVVALLEHNAQPADEVA